MIHLTTNKLGVRMEVLIWILIGIFVFNLLFLSFILWKYGIELFFKNDDKDKVEYV